MSGPVRHLQTVINLSSLSWDPHPCYPSPYPSPPFKLRHRKHLDLAWALSEILSADVLAYGFIIFTGLFPKPHCLQLFIHASWLGSGSVLEFWLDFWCHSSVYLVWGLQRDWLSSWHCSSPGGGHPGEEVPTVLDSPWLPAHPCLWRSPDPSGPCCCCGKV